MKKKLFIGIAPDKTHLPQLNELQQMLASAGRLVKSENIHMTLFFLGMVEDSAARDFEEAVDSVNWPAFKVTFDSLSFWRRPGVIALTGVADDSNLKYVVDRISEIAADTTMKTPRHGFTPHITLVRKAKNLPGPAADPMQAEPLMLMPEMIHLYHSVNSSDGVEYRIIKSWPLE